MLKWQTDKALAFCQQRQAASLTLGDEHLNRHLPEQEQGTRTGSAIQAQACSNPGFDAR